MATVRIPDVQIQWNGKDANELRAVLRECTFNDVEHGRADDLKLVFHDTESLWKGEFYPERGDRIKVKLGWKDGDLLDCGTFQLDSFRGHAEPTGRGDYITVQAHSAWVKSKLRQANSEVYEDVKLSSLVKKIASRQGFESDFEGDDVDFTTITQWRSPDADFLRKLAELYGFIFKIADGKFVFYALEKIEEQGEVATFTSEEVRSYDLENHTESEAKTARAVSYDPYKSKLYESTKNAKKSIVKDEFRLTRRFENTAQSERAAKAAMRRSEYRRTEGTIVLTGNPLVQAGVCIRLKGYRRWDGLYYVDESMHRIRANKTKDEYYETHCMVRKIKD
jgi:uncharacterized protein